MRPLPFIHKNWPGILLLGALLNIFPFWIQTGYVFFLFNIMALNAIVVLGLNLLIGSTGQVSLGHAAFYGMGAYLAAIAGTTWHWPIPISFAFALLAVAITSFFLALPSLRLEGHYLVMATLGFNIIVSILLGQLEAITGGPSGFPGISRLHVGSYVLKSDREFYYFIWGLFLIVFTLTLNLTDSRPGRALRAIHEKDLTAQALGIPSYRYKVTTFVLSALYACVAGFCYAHYVTFISPKTFDIFHSVQVVTMVVVGGMGSLWGGLAGTTLLTCLPEFLHRFEDLHVLIYGLILTGVLVFSPRGLVPTILTLTSFAWTRVRKAGQAAPARLDRPQRPPLIENVLPVVTQPPPSKATRLENTGSWPADPILDVKEISLSFGGLQALCNVSFQVFPGEVVALIGPNGAGKTTLLNVISGLLKPQEGEILLDGRSLLQLLPHQIAAQGIGRTFQAVQVFYGFTVLENILLGLHVRGRSGFMAAYLRTPRERMEEESLRKEAFSLLSDFQLADKAFLPAQSLSLLEQKKLELARALALSPRVLLLDEPVGGLNPRESDLLVEYFPLFLKRGLGVVLVEHDMNVVMRIASRVVVLQYGSGIACGTPREVQQDPRVIAAYLGSRKDR